MQISKKRQMNMSTKQFQKENLSCGLDFGTSNSVISITDLSSREELFTTSLQSILYFPEGDANTCYVGREAEEKYVEEGMKGRLLKSVKTLLKQDKFLFTWIGGRKVTPDQMATYIIRKLKEQAEEFLGFPIDKVTLGRPAIFSEKEQEEKTAVARLLTAARNAGFSEVQLQLEPIAAALSYERGLQQAETVLVADFGGGTSDFTIISLSPDKIGRKDRSHDILAHGGLYIGGDLFDSEIMWHRITPLLGRGVEYQSYGKSLEVPHQLYRELRNWEKSFLLKDSKPRRMMDKYYVFSNNDPRINNVRVLIDHNYVYSLFKEIEKTKIRLSGHDQSFLQFIKEDLSLETDLGYNDYEQMIGTHIAAIESYVKNMLAASGYSPEQIDTVYLTGGSSLSRSIQGVFAGLFGEGKLRSGDTFHSVVHGLSLCTA